jgi:hypothetical protein
MCASPKVKDRILELPWTAALWSNAFTRLFVDNRRLAQSLGALKAMMGVLSLCGPGVLPPLPPPSPQEQETLQRQFLAWQGDHTDINYESYL